MIGGLLVDALVVAAVAAFGWAGMQLGGVASLQRAVSSIVGFLAAAIMREPAGLVVQGVLGASEDFCRLVGMVAVGIGAYIATTRLFEWWRARSATGDDTEPGAPVDTLESSTTAMVAGGALGLGWSLLFAALLVMLPADNPISRAAANSYTGAALIAQEGGLRWLADGFPHYTQTLPKGKVGVVVGERASLPLHGTIEPEDAAGDHDLLLRVINRERRARSVSVLAFNPDLGSVAQRHATALAADRSLSYSSPGGGTLDGRARAALGEAAGGFDDEVGIEVAWAHGAANAGRGMLDDTRGGALLRDGRWSEVGVGVADAGWFNGRIYVLLLVGPTEGPEDDAATMGGAAGAVGALPEEVDAGLPPSDDGAATDPLE